MARRCFVLPITAAGACCGCCCSPSACPPPQQVQCSRAVVRTVGRSGGDGSGSLNQTSTEFEGSGAGLFGSDCRPVPAHLCAVVFDEGDCGGWRLEVPQGELKFKWSQSPHCTVCLHCGAGGTPPMPGTATISSPSP